MVKVDIKSHRPQLFTSTEVSLFCNIMKIAYPMPELKVLNKPASLENYMTRGHFHDVSLASSTTPVIGDILIPHFFDKH